MVIKCIYCDAELKRKNKKYIDSKGHERCGRKVGNGYAFKDHAPNKTRAERIPKVGYVYLIKDDNLYKIGCSSDVDNRAKGLSTGSSSELKSEHVFPASDKFKAEAILKNLYKEFCVRREWFNLTNEQVDEIKSILSFDDASFSNLVNKKKEEYSNNLHEQVRNSVWGLFGKYGRTPTEEEVVLYGIKTKEDKL